MSDIVKPFLKWAGGKRQLLEGYDKLLPREFGRYHEPFVGGGAMFFHLASAGHIRRGSTLSDVNEPLMRVYQYVRDCPEDVIDSLRKLPADSELVYYKARERYNFVPITDFEKAILFIYLNKAGFNGLYRVNGLGEFNVPYGHFEHPSIPIPSAIRAAAEALQGVGLYPGDFDTLRTQVRTGDLAYFDPPYVPLTETANFTSYTVGGFGWDEQVRLAHLFRDLAARGVYVMASNHSQGGIVQLYTQLGVENFNVRHTRARRSINSDGDKRGPVLEVVFRNFKTASKGEPSW